MNEWRRVVLDDLIRLQRGFDLPTPERQAGNIPVVGAAGISGRHSAAMTSGPGVVVGRAGASMGKATYVPSDFWPLNTSLFVTDFRGNDPRFIFYLLSQIDFSGFNSGAAQPMLNRNYIKQVPLEVPALAEQRAIAGMLGAIDDKVIVCARVAWLLEELSIAVSSEKKWVATASLGECVTHRRHQVLPSQMTVETVANYSLPAFDSGRLPDHVSPEVIKSGKFVVDQPSVLVSKLNPSIRRIWGAIPNGIPALASTEFLVLVPIGDITVAEIWAVCNQPGFTGHLMEHATGTSNSHQRVSPAGVLAAKVVDPRRLPDRVRDEIGAQFDRARAARREAAILAKLRDTLLPELMSGRLRIKDAEKIVQDST